MKALVVDADKNTRFVIRQVFESRHYQVIECSDGYSALDCTKQHPSIEAIVIDISTAGFQGGEVLQKFKEMRPQVFCLLLIKPPLDAVSLPGPLRLYDSLSVPVQPDQVEQWLDATREAKSLAEVAAFSAPQIEFDEGRTLIGGSDQIQRVFQVIYKLSKVDTSVLIRGESGTGKELVARALHYNSHRKRGPFVAVNCAAIPEYLIESELFGHEKGAFTGADKKKMGKFQYAQGGTLFLDEIGDISPSMQVKLLRVLQDKTFTSVGGLQEIKMEVRIIAATNRPLETMIENSQFRADLFYRLNVLPILLPPLRERIEDLPHLIQYMIHKYNALHRRQITHLDSQAFARLHAYHWPGNIRELENMIEHAFIMEPSAVITLASLPTHMLSARAPKLAVERSIPQSASLLTHPDLSLDLNYPVLKERFEKDFLIRALRTFSGKINQTAMHTKMTKLTLLRKLDKYGINPKDFYPAPRPSYEETL